MPILKNLNAPNGAQCTLHQVLHVESNITQAPEVLLVRLASYVTEDNLSAEQPAYHWSPLLVPFLGLNPTDFFGSIEQVLLAASDSPFVGGSQIAAVGDLQKARDRRWAQIKQLREAHEFGPLTWDGSVFDADERAQLRIMGAVQLAAQAVAAGQPFSMDWTLADNSIRTLSAADLMALGEALGQQVASAHETARLLREAIDAAATVAEVQSIDWPTT
ncbi:protein of unknown function [Roseateles sp. YR242]|uniref:DUF4376 domain-containing protein n=1 Tax=Roseateles sp. YR242 TaxID=1855305 RepID=UPI0008CDED39|nr:DUF4376 domain-containing protein [Roseateles sp. YR242]SEL11782.1 protein of unknown function [Roseateles sp. YR242]